MPKKVERSCRFQTCLPGPDMSIGSGHVYRFRTCCRLMAAACSNALGLHQLRKATAECLNSA